MEEKQNLQQKLKRRTAEALRLQDSAAPASAESHSPWQQLKEILDEALALPTSERIAFVERACGHDEGLRSEVLSFLELGDQAQGFLEKSPVGSSGVDEPVMEGAVVGPYRILRSLGAGGMGEVYLAERADGAFEQQIAIKVIRARGLLAEEIVSRFRSERQLLAELQHPNIAHLLDGGTTDEGRPYLVMDYVDGEAIDAYCRSRDLSVEDRLRLFLKVCDAVQHAHRHLVVHRDLKPSNILVTDEGVPQLLDFGVAKDLSERGKTPDTRLMVPVTPEYASPEQLAGGLVTTATDVYTLGVVLYELLTGHSPFGDLDDPLAGRSRAAPPGRPSTRIGGRTAEARRLRSRLGGDLDHIVLRALEPDPERRYPSVEQLARDLVRHLQGLPLETRPGSLYRVGKLVRRHWRGLAAAALTITLAAFLVQQTLQRRQADRERERVATLSRELKDYMVGILQVDVERTGERSETLRRILDQAAALLDSGYFVEEPLLRAELLGAVGQVYRRQSRLRRAEALQRESLAIRRPILPPDHEDLVAGCNNLAVTLRDLGLYSEARALYWEVRDILNRRHPGDHPDRAVLLNNLAGVEKDLGNFETAVALYEEALAMKRRLPDVFDAGDLAMALKNLGTGLRAAGRLDAAEETLRDAVRQAAHLEELSTTLTAGVDHHLGALLRERGDLAASRELLERTLESRRDLYEEGHDKIHETLLELAQVDELEGRLEDAERRVRRVVEARRDRWGIEHIGVAEALIPLARFLARRGDVEGARVAAEEALAVFRDRLPADHWRIVEAESLRDSLRL